MRKYIKYYVISSEDPAGLSHLCGYAKTLNGKAAVATFARKIEELKCKGYILSAEFAGRLIGVITLIKPDKPDYRDWWLYDFFVHEHYRGFGIGNSLLEMALQKAISQNAEKVNAYVIKEDKRAVSLYYKMGFQRIVDPELDAKLNKYGLYRFIPQSR